MDTLEAIHTRRSILRTVGPAPTRDQITQLLHAAVRAPNHHLTEPWRFVVLSGGALTELGEVLAASARDAGVNVEAARRLPRLAPTVVVVIDRAGNDHHVPAADEHYAVGAAMQNLLLAAHATGLGAMIRTGIHVRSSRVREHLGVKPDEQIAGFVYLGRIPDDAPPGSSRRTPPEDLTEWRTD
jgi:nitroreductase